MFIYQFCTVYKPTKRKQWTSITTVSIDHVLPKIDLEIEHVLIGVENRRRFSELKIGVVFAWHTFRKSVPIFDSEKWRRFSTPCVFSLTLCQPKWRHQIPCKPSNHTKISLILGVRFRTFKKDLLVYTHHTSHEQRYNTPESKLRLVDLGVFGAFTPPKLENTSKQKLV